MIVNIPIPALVPSGTNPRKHFDATATAELAESVRTHGVLQPILVRHMETLRVAKAVTLPGEKGGYSVVAGHVPTAGRIVRTGMSKRDAEKFVSEYVGATYEIVCGERRWRAAREAGLADIPAIVRELTDAEALEIQVVENLQRADLHPLDEAEGYQALLARGTKIDDLAAKVGKSKPYIYGRVRLSALCDEAKDALWSDKLSVSVALLLARLPDQETQVEAMRAFDTDFAGPVTTVEAARVIALQFSSRLKDAPWDITDTTLIPSAGACATCSKCTGNNPDLFADVDDKATCTDRKCYSAKRQAHIKRKADELAEAGATILSGKDAEAQYQWNSLKEKWCNLADRCEALGYESKKSWSKALGAKCPPKTHIIKDDGSLTVVVNRKAAMDVLRDAGLLKDETGEGEIPVDEPPKSRAEVIKENKLEAQRADAVAASAIQAALLATAEEFLVMCLMTCDYRVKLNLEHYVPHDPGLLATGLLKMDDEARRTVIVRSIMERKPGKWDRIAVYAIAADYFGVDTDAIDRSIKE